MTLWVTVLSYVVAVLGVVLVAAYMYMGRKYDHWKKKGVKYLKPLPFIGNMKDMVLLRRNMGEVFKEVYDRYKKEPIMGLYSFDSPILLINDINITQAILIKDFQYFSDRNLEMNEKIDPLGARNLFSLRGDRWKQARNAITPSFSSGKMKRMFQIVDENGRALAETLNRENKGEPITAFELCGRYTMDVIASCAFGINSGTLQNPHSEFRRKLKMFSDFSPIEGFIVLLAFLCPKLLEITNIKIMKPEVEEYVTNIVRTSINYREKETTKRNDLLQSLIEIMKEGEVSEIEKSEYELKNKIKMDETDVTSHSMAFLTAGFETSAITMSYVLYELSKNPQIQGQLRDEINGVLKENNGHVPYDALHSMKYLDMVFQETLRKYPPVPFVDRRSNAAYRLPGSQLTLEADSVVIIPLLGIHRDPEIYPNPMEFLPERFSEENKGTRPSCTYMPFGEGPRSCVGLRFALIQSKLGLIHILKDHSVHRPSCTPEELEFSAKSFIYQPKEHVRLVFRRLE